MSLSQNIKHPFDPGQQAAANPASVCLIVVPEVSGRTERLLNSLVQDEPKQQKSKRTMRGVVFVN